MCSQDGGAGQRSQIGGGIGICEDSGTAKFPPVGSWVGCSCCWAGGCVGAGGTGVSVGAGGGVVVAVSAGGVSVGADCSALVAAIIVAVGAVVLVLG